MSAFRDLATIANVSIPWGASDVTAIRDIDLKTVFA